MNLEQNLLLIRAAMFIAPIHRQLGPRAKHLMRATNKSVNTRLKYEFIDTKSLINDTRMQVFLLKRQQPTARVKLRPQTSTKPRPTQPADQNGKIYTIAQWYPPRHVRI